MAALDADSVVPWQRVVNAQGRVSVRADGQCEPVQQLLLEEEGLDWNGMMHNGRFLSVDELLSVPGITPELFHGEIPEEREALVDPTQSRRRNARGRLRRPFGDRNLAPTTIAIKSRARRPGAGTTSTFLPRVRSTGGRSRPGAPSCLAR